MDDIQSWWEVPSIAHFCSLFRAAFNLLDFDIEELENALLTDGIEDAGSSLLQELIVKLLTGCLNNNGISTSNYQMFLRRLFRQKCKEYGRENPFDNDIDFQFLSLRTKVEILHSLCDYRLDAEDVMDLLKNLDSDSLRVYPLGRDRNKSVFWYFYGTRLYREDHNKQKEVDKKGEKRGRGRKKSKEKGKGDKFDANEIGTGEWNVVCYSESDWERLVHDTEGSGDKEEESLHQILAKDFLPEIPRLFEEKERLQRKRLLEMQPRRQSSRIEKLKHQKEVEKQVEMERRKEEIERRKLDEETAAQNSEEDDTKKKERIRKDRERRKQERDMRRARWHASDSSDWKSSSDEESEKQYEKVMLADDKGKPKGRQTNNSLSSATGQIIIQSQPVRQKIRTSQVFPTSFEDIKIGMYKIIEKIKNHEDAWPFLYPVESEDAPRYYKVIKEPMDLQTMEDKLDNREYFSVSQFKRDFQLIVENCKKFNGPSSDYSGMVVSLEKEFNALVSKYLAELSSDEELAVEFPEEHRKHKKKHHKSSNHHRSSSWSKKHRHDEYLDDKENEDRSSTPPESSYVTKTARSVRSVSSSVDEKLDDSQDDELEDTRSSDSRTRRKSMHSKKSSEKERSSQKKPPVKNTVKSAAAIEALELATEQTLKDINKWLDDTPKFSDYSCDNSSPAHHLGVVDDIEVQNRIESEYRRSLLEKPPRLQKESLKRRHLKDPQNVIKKKREIQRKIDRLQPGKSKGNLLSTNKQPPEETSVSGSNSKESMKIDETDSDAPKLSLGTVLLSGDIGLGSLGSKKQSFGDSPPSDTKYSDDEKYEVSSKIKEPKLDYVDSDIKLVDTSDLKPTETVISEEKKEEDDLEEKPEIKSTSSVPEKSSAKAESASTKEKPNLSAWFKAFGAPKTAAAPKRKSDTVFGNPPTPSPSVDFKDSSNDLQSYSKFRYLDDKPLDSPNDLPPMTPGRSLSPDDKDRKNIYNSPEVRPGTRKRKVSTGSSVSERSSFSQDPTDPMLSPHPTLSPHPSLDEPYLSPQQDAAKSFHHSPVNGTIKVGFYQDTFPRGGSDKSNSCSPREQLPSNSPRNLGLSPKNPHPDSPDYHRYSAPSTPVYQAPASPAPAYNSALPFYPGHSSLLSQNIPYYDVNKSVTDQYNTTATSHQRAPSPTPSPPVQKPPISTLPAVNEKPVSVYPVKKRAYCEVEPDPPQQQSVIKPVMEKSSGFTPLASVRDPERVFTPTPGRMPQSTERAIGLHHRYPNELLQSSPYYANDNIFSKNVAPVSTVPPPSSYSKAEDVATTASYCRNVESTNSSSSYSAYNRISAPVYNYPNPVDRVNPRPEKQVPLNYSTPPSSSEMLSSRNTPAVNFSNVAANSPNLISKSTAPTLNYLDRSNPELLNFSKMHPASSASDSGRQTELTSRMVENPGRNNQHLSYPQSRASYSKVDLNPPQSSRVHYSNPITDLSSKINIPSGLGYPPNQPGALAYSHPMGDMRYNYPAMMSEMMAGKSSVNYPPHTAVGYNVDAYKHPMVDLMAANKTPVSEPQPAAKTPKVVPPKKASRSKKKATAEAEVSHPHPESNLNPISSSGYQQYSGQASAEPISLKTTSVVPGSAFNFGPAPLKDGYSSYLGEMSRSGYYLPHSGAGIPEAGSNDEKGSASSSHAAPSYPFPRAPYPHLTHHSPAIYQQYLQRHQQDLLRPMGLHGLLAPPSGYPPGYIMHDPLNRPPPWM
nr:PREDICTED: uncharacterized protein LOC109042290 [Bemisia tabaci]